MPTTAELQRAVGDALARLSREPGVREVEVFAAANRALLARLSYTSNIACNGVEEPKSAESHGFGVQVVLDGPDGPLIGFGAEPSDLSVAGAERAMAKARRAAVRDPEFYGLPEPSAEPRQLDDYHDPEVAELADERLVEVGWQALHGALGAFLASSRLAALAGDDEGLRRLGLIVGGDVTLLTERIAIASSRMPRPQSDESTLCTSSLTAMVESRGAKGSGWSTGTRVVQLDAEAGTDAARSAIEAIGGEDVPAGDYTVVFGPQPVTDLFNNLLLPACHASSFFSLSTPFLGKLGQRVVAEELSIHDHGALRGLMGSKGITCEGLPTGRTDLIKDGRLVGLLASWYDAQRLLRDPGAREKLGVAPEAAAAALVARNGFRYGERGGRAFETQPGTAASNVLVEARGAVPRDELIRRVGNGLYVGRIWYTYPINGLRAGDFTCTVVGDSFIIRDGRIGPPLRANNIRINDNIVRLLRQLVGVSESVKGTLVWAADEVVHAPEMAVAGVHVDEVADPAENLPPAGLRVQGD